MQVTLPPYQLKACIFLSSGEQVPQCLKGSSPLAMEVQSYQSPLVPPLFLKISQGSQNVMWSGAEYNLPGASNHFMLFPDF